MTNLGVWQPLTPASVEKLFDRLHAPWWIAGGLAIDAFLGRTSREHGDIDVGVLRRDQLEVQAALTGWDLQAADPPGKLRPWLAGETLPESVHDIWCRRSTDAAWGLQLMLEQADGEEWEYRRSIAVHRPINSLTWPFEGVPYLAVEVQLLYKAGAMSPKNLADFEACDPLLSDVQRNWLRTALALAHPGHPWIARLTRPGVA
jgi:hypothetical protein